MKQIILTIAAHPDDEVLGCGATVARLVAEGAEAYTLILGEGITSRSGAGAPAKPGAALAALQEQARQAARMIGVADVFFAVLPDNRFDSVPLLDIVKAVEEVKQRIKPTLMFTHFAADLNIDHRLTYQAVLTATRPMAGETVRGLYSFEVLSSTEWHYPLSFAPDTFFDVATTIERKLQAMALYRGELRDFPHPRSLEGIRINARQWGMKTGMAYAEAFATVRILR